MSACPKLPRDFIVPIAVDVVDVLSSNYSQLKVCGSLRRGCLEVGDIDIVVINKDTTLDPLELLKTKFKAKKQIEEKSTGPRECYIIMHNKLPIHVDIWTTTEDRYGAGIMYATGPGTMNVIMRRWAKFNNLFLSFSGVKDKEGNVIAAKTEHDCFNALGWEYKSPVEREYYDSFVQKYLDIMDEDYATKERLK